MKKAQTTGTQAERVPLTPPPLPCPRTPWETKAERQEDPHESLPPSPGSRHSRCPWFTQLPQSSSCPRGYGAAARIQQGGKGIQTWEASLEKPGGRRTKKTRSPGVGKDLQEVKAEEGTRSKQADGEEAMIQGQSVRMSGWGGRAR